MRFVPCRVCKNPVHTTRKSACCSRDKCIEKDSGTDNDEPPKIEDVKAFNRKVVALQRGY